jgi:hypothetical protein
MKNVIQLICKLTVFIILMNVNLLHGREINLPSSAKIKYKADCAQSKYEIYYNSSWSYDNSKIIYIKYNGVKINIDSINISIGDKGIQLLNIWCYKQNDSNKLKNGDALVIIRLGGPNRINKIEKSLLNVTIINGKVEIINEADKDEPHIQFFEPNQK